MMKDDKYAYCLMGVENQTGIHYAMPVRNGLYDFLQLSHQVSVIEKAHRNDIKVDAEQSIKKRISSGEYLSGFYKGDRLLPVIILVIFWGDVEWDAPLSLKEMYNEVDEKVMKYVPDYRVNLIAPNCMSDEKINEFHSSLKEIMLYIKYSNDIEKLRDIANKDHNFQHLERTAVDILNAVTNSNLKYDSNKEEVDVCKAIIELREEGREEGRREAIIGCAKKYANHNVNENIIINILSEELNLNEEEALNIYYNEVLQ